MELIETATIIDKGARTLTQADKALLVRFKLMSAETENENNRVYPVAVLKKAVEDLKARLTKKKNSFALNGHQDDESLDDVSAVLEDVTMEGNDVYATAKILPTQRGKNVQAIIRNGGAVGVSAKCNGRVEKGRVQPGLILRGFDFCTSPGFGTYATKANIIESVTVEDEEDGQVTEEQLRGFGLIENGPKELTEQAVQARFQQACLAGYRGDLEQYSKLVLKMN
jgi:hypothetical protein